MRTAAAKAKLAEEEDEKAESAKIMNPAELVDSTLNLDILCLPCEDEAYGGRLDFRLFSADHRLADEGVRSSASLTKPLRKDTISVNSHGSTRLWLASAD